MDLEGANALVTGSSSGLGQAIAERLAQDGCHVAVHYAGNAEGARATAKLVEDAGGESVVLQADLTDPGAAADLAEEAERTLGPLDVLVNNAGVIDAPGEGERGKKPLRERAGEWDRVVNVNLRAPFILSTTLAPRMVERGEGVIVNVASIAGWYTNLEVPLYSLTKNGLMHLTRQLALEYAPEVRVNAVAPGWVPTGFGWGHLESEAFREAITPTIPLDRMGEREEIADAVRFLCTAGSYTTGATLTADGGLGAKLR